MIVSMIKIVVTPDKKDEILEILFSLKGPTEVKHGCINCRIYQDLQDNNIIYKETWKDKESLDKHIRSDLYRDILAVIDMSSEQPGINFFTVSSVAGIELIQETLGYN
ncbi:MAG: antibiotic biosynthesis monooxygenase [Deltaproteobacteria bacterium]|nr:antibiotic biosynthesis monooxygenase [Deltaproteobacteria bacterium]